MKTSEAMENVNLRKMVQSLDNTLGERLRSVVLYGSAARGDYQKATSDFNLLVVVDELNPSTLESLSPIILRWCKQNQPFPRIFSPKLIAESTDVFPIEFLDIRCHHLVLHGEDLGVERPDCIADARPPLDLLLGAPVEHLVIFAHQPEGRLLLQLDRSQWIAKRQEGQDATAESGLALLAVHRDEVRRGGADRHGPGA